METTMTVAGVVTDMAPIVTLFGPYLLGAIALVTAWKAAPRLLKLFKKA